MTSDEHDQAWAEESSHLLDALTRDELEALGDALDHRVRGGTATLEDFGALARVRRELARRAELGRWARSRGAVEPV